MNHQLHVDIDKETIRELKKILPETRMVSFVVRKLVKKYVQDVKNGASPWCFIEGDKK